jgi:hypothetical protein
VLLKKNVDGRDIGERKRRRPSDGYVASGSDAVLRTAMWRAEATPSFGRLCPALTKGLTG